MIRYATVSLFALAAAGIAPSAPAMAADAAADTIVVSASRSGEGISASLLGSSVTVLDAQALEGRQTRVLSDVLRDVPGVAINRTGAIGGTTQVRIRGSEGNHVLVFIDGIKASDSYQGEYDFGNLLADEHARVEVLRGQQSALYGSDAIGGVITYTTLSGREAPGVRLRGEGGSFNTWSAAGRLAGMAGDSFDYTLSATYLMTDGFATAPAGSRNLASDNLGTSARFNWTPSPDFRLTAVARYSYTKADQNDQMIDAASPVVQGYPVITAVDSPDNRYRNKALYALLRAELDLLDDIWTTTLSGQLTDARRDSYGSFGYSYGNRGRRYRGSFENTLRFGDERLKHRFTFAIDAEREEFRAVDPSGYAFTGQHRIDTLGFVAQYDLTLDERLAVGASARIDRNDRFEDAATWRLTGSYLFDSGTRIRAAAGVGVKAPTSDELFGYVDGWYIGNPGLQPERSRGWEAGLEQALLDGGLTIGATYFHNRFDQRIETVGAMVGGVYISTSRNNAEISRQRGIEAFAEARLGEFRADASYAWLKAPQRINALAGPAPTDGSFQMEVPVETQAVRRPKHIGSFNLSYAPEALPLTATLTLRYNGQQRDYAFNSMYQRLLVDMKAFTLVNLNASYDIGDHLQLFGRVENLLDANYQEVFTFAAAGRTAYGGLRVRF